MPLATGTKLGPYDLNGVLGAGGMGEVYRARDPRLNREVAIKVLPTSFAADQQRLNRFEQEAMAAAALNHPNILAVYDVGTQDGVPYIVSELLEGETLRDRLRSGALSIRKTIDYSIQIARALAAAHEKGIVHRDLKPDNIFITRDGRVKLLDFGLAKLTQSTPILNESETRTIQSEPGTVLGTVGYMSPEQVRGRAGDARSDLFAFGAVLYEMVSGKRAFHGQTPADTISSILHDEPPELTETNRNVPPALERVVRHCLEKSPDERFQSARDVAFDLDALTSVSTSTTATRKAAATSRRRTTILAMVAVASLAALAAFVAGQFRSRNISGPVFHRITYERGSVIAARFSVDGHSVVYEAAWEGRPAQLFSTPTKGPEPRALELQDAHLFAISRDGEAALGLGGRVVNHLSVTGATLARSPLGGGAPRQLLENVAVADWGPDGSLAVGRWMGGLMRVEYPIGKPLYETSGWISDMRISPSGDKIAFLDHPVYPDDRGWVAVVDLAGNKKVLSGEWESEDGLAWTPDGKEVWFAATGAGIDRTLYAVNLSGRRRTVLSVPGSLRIYDIYPDGRVLLTAGHERVGMLGITADGKQRDLSWSGWTIAYDVSPDGNWVLFDEQSEFAGSNYTVAMRKMDGSPPVKLSDGVAAAYSPDGKWLAAVMPSDTTKATLLPIGPGDSKVVPISGLYRLLGAAVWKDMLIVSGAESGHGVRCYKEALGGGPLTPLTDEGVRFCRSSPDGRYIVTSEPAGIKLYPLSGGSPRLLANSTGLAPIVWTNDHAILAWPTGTVPARVVSIDVTTGKQSFVRELVPGDLAGVSHVQTVTSSPDGKVFAYSYGQTLSELYVVEGLK